MYTLINCITGTTFGSWNNYDSAESYKLMLDDWMNWNVVKKDEI